MKFEGILNLGRSALLAGLVLAFTPAFAGEVDEELGDAPERIIVHKDPKTKELSAYKVPADVKFEATDGEKLSKEELEKHAQAIVKKVVKKENKINSDELSFYAESKSELAGESGTVACWWPWRRWAWVQPVAVWPSWIGWGGGSWGWGWGWGSWGFYGGCW